MNVYIRDEDCFILKKLSAGEGLNRGISFNGPSTNKSRAGTDFFNPTCTKCKQQKSSRWMKEGICSLCRKEKK